MKELGDLAGMMAFLREYTKTDAKLASVFTELNQTLVDLLAQKENAGAGPDHMAMMCEAMKTAVRDAVAGIQLPAPQITFQPPAEMPEKPEGQRVLDVVLHRSGRLGNGPIERLTITETRGAS